MLSMKTAMGKFLRSRPVLYRVGSLLFMHGGMTNATVSYFRNEIETSTVDSPDFVTEVNRRVRKALEEMETNSDGVPVAPPRDNIARFILDYDYDSKLSGDRSPILVHPLDKCDEVQHANAHLKIGAQVVGHTPHDPPQFWFCNGSLLAVDFHISKWKANGTSYGALQLLRRASLAKQLASPSVTDWDTSLIVPHADELNRTPAPALFSSETAVNYVVAVIASVVAIEAVRMYLRQRHHRPQ